jgi:hypothetical protein
MAAASWMAGVTTVAGWRGGEVDGIWLFKGVLFSTVNTVITVRLRKRGIGA